MLERLELAAIRFRLGMKNRLEKFKSDERGMATVEMVILIVVAVILIGFIVNFLTRNGFGPNKDMGLIEFLFDKMRTSLTDTFSKAEGK